MALSLDKVERERRYASCRKCPDLQVSSLPLGIKVERCGVCGCLIVSRAVVGCPKSKF